VPRGVPKRLKASVGPCRPPLPVRLLNLYVGIDAPIWKSMRKVLVNPCGGEGDIATRITDLVDLSRREHDSKPVCTRRLQVHE
jgi:hypothetical protein